MPTFSMFFRISDLLSPYNRLENSLPHPACSNFQSSPQGQKYHPIEIPTRSRPVQSGTVIPLPFRYLNVPALLFLTQAQLDQSFVIIPHIKNLGFPSEIILVSNENPRILFANVTYNVFVFRMFFNSSPHIITITSPLHISSFEVPKVH